MAAFNVPLASWLLAVVTFVLGAIATPLYQRYTFDGIVVNQLSDLSLAFGSDGVLVYATAIKVVNTTKSAVALESVSSDIPGRSSTKLKHIGSTAFFTEATEEPTFRLYRSKDNKDEKDLPLLIPPESSRTLAVKLAFLPEGVTISNQRVGLPAGHERLLEEAFAQVVRPGFDLSLNVNGKIRELTVRAKLNAYDFP